MTIPIYLQDAYAADIETTVLDVDGRRVRLRETPFYPGGGGLQPDRGSLRWEANEAPVTAHHRDGEALWHELDGGVPAVGTPVRAVVNWPHRYGIMRYHTAVHVLSGVVYHVFGAVVTGGQVYADRARMDFALEDLTRERVSMIEGEANRVIAEGRPIVVRFLPRGEFERYDLIRTARNLVPAHVDPVRIVEIEGYDAQADGGTHVRNTREIGVLRVVKTENKGRVNRRLEIALDPPDG